MEEYDSDSEFDSRDPTGTSSPTVRMSETLNSPKRSVARSFSFQNIQEFGNSKEGKRCLRKCNSAVKVENIEYNTSKYCTVTIDQWGRGSDRDCSDPKITKKVEDAMVVLKNISNNVSLR